MTTLVERLLDTADELIDAHPNSSAVKRRAVSTAYYAAFHALARTCADVLVPDLDRSANEYERAYRALDHGSLKNAFQPTNSPLRKHDALKRIGDLIVPLQSARILADYAPPRPGFYEANEAKDRVAEAREVVESLQALAPEIQLTLAVHLVFKDRNK